MLGSKVLGLFDKETLTMDVVDEQLDTIGKSILGMTLGCARCHDHKFDPIPQRDYYALAGIFTSTVTLRDRLGGPKEDESDWNRRGLGADGDTRWDAFWREHRYEWVSAIKSVHKARKKISELAGKRRRSNYDMQQDPVAGELAKYRQELVVAEQNSRNSPNNCRHWPWHRSTLPSPPTPNCEFAAWLRVAPSRASCFLQIASFVGQPEVNRQQSGRLELARWIADERNPLTARVWVNRVWKHLFREGIVRSTDNFGTTGEVPSHPELLDHLSSQFVADGWSTKQLIRAVVLSRAYRQATTGDPAALAIDAENRWLWRQNRRRLEPEELRDSLLWHAGRLDLSPAHEGVIICR